MLDTLLEIGESFDWLTPLVAVAQDIANGPSYTFFVPEDSAHRRPEIGRMLREHGVKYWGMMIVNHELMLTVRQKQARWAGYLLQRAGVPLLNPISSGQVPTGGSAPTASSGPRPKPAGHSFFDDLNGLLDSMAGWLGL